MIDLQLLRQNPELVKAAARNKGIAVDIDALLRLDEEQLSLQRKVEELRARRNKLSAAMKKGQLDPDAIAEARALRERGSELESTFEAARAEFLSAYKKVPNIPTSDTPIGSSENENIIVRSWGQPRVFTFPPLNHSEIANHHGWIDKERASKVTGARFAYLKGDLVKLQFALMAWTMDKLTDEAFLSEIISSAGLSIAPTPFVPVLPPYMIRTSIYEAMDRLEPTDERYRIEKSDLWLQGSAEHVLGSMYANEILDESQMPVRYLGYATSFRKEAGAAGKDMEGIIRLHQFDKLEIESFSTKETSHEEHLFFSAIQERLMQLLEIPYQKLQKCTYDIGKPNAKGSDIEAWLPGQKKYRETHTADYMTDYQARRLNTRVRRSDKSLEFVHTNDATAFACGRTMVAIIENFQNEDLSVTVPSELQPYMAGRVKLG